MPQRFHKMFLFKYKLETEKCKDSIIIDSVVLEVA